MARVWRLVALGVGAYLLILVISFPAARVSGMLQDRIPDLSLNGVSGSVFSGQALQLVYQGLDLGEVHWGFRPFSLLLGRIEYHLDLKHPANHGELNIGRTLGGRTFAHDIDIELLPGRLANHYSPRPVDTSGTLQLVFDTFSPGEDYSGEVEGRLEWRDATVLEPINLVLGQLGLDVRTENGELVGRITEGGDLGASGEVALSPVNAYRVDLVLHPAGNVSADTLELLEQSAERLPDGGYRLDLSGQF